MLILFQCGLQLHVGRQLSKKSEKRWGKKTKQTRHEYHIKNCFLYYDLILSQQLYCMADDV